MGRQGTRGILNPLNGLAHFALDRELPPEDLARYVERFWTVRWDLEGQPPFEQQILPYPNVNISRRAGSPFEVHGPGTKRFITQLTGRGWVLGAKFTPAGFSAFARVPMRSLVDRVLSIEEVTGCAAPVLACEDPAAARVAIETFLRQIEPKPDHAIAVVNALVARTEDDRSIARVDDLARVANTSVRSLHRMFERYIGVGPKWVVRRARVQQAAERVARGERVDWAETAQELGYHDQAHLIRDFRAQVGFTPAAYARRCAAAVGAPATVRSPQA